MFNVNRSRTVPQTAFSMLLLIHENTVRSIRKEHSNAIIGLLMNIVQVLVMLAVFYLMVTLMGMRRTAIRGDFIVYLLSGIFIYQTNIRSVGAVASAEGPTSSMMLHAPMNMVISICSAALGALYTQALSILTILIAYDLATGAVQILDPVGFACMIVLSWLNGISVGLVLLAFKPWWPAFFRIVQTLYRRANMVASGKMFTANSLTATMLAMFDWNPLFHIIDQARGFAFVNYFPRYTSITYPVYVTIVLVVIGLMAEYFTRHRVSASWFAGK